MCIFLFIFAPLYVPLAGEGRPGQWLFVRINYK